MRRLKYLIPLVFVYSLVFPNNNPQTENQEPGYILITMDSLSLPLFVDGVLIGLSPLPNPIPVPAGFHQVTYLPPEISMAKINVRFPDSIKKVYVTGGDTTKVDLYYTRHYQDRVSQLRKEQKIVWSTGSVLIGILLFIIWSVS